MKNKIAFPLVLSTLYAMMIMLCIGATTLNRTPASDYLASSFGARNGITLTNAIKQLDNRSVNLIIDGGVWQISNNVAFPSNMSVQITPGSWFNVYLGRKITFSNNAFVADCQLCFAGNGSATGTAKFLYRWPQWGNENRFVIGNGQLSSAIVSNQSFTMVSGTTGDFDRLITEKSTGGTGYYYALTFQTGDVGIIQGRGNGGTVDVYKVVADQFIARSGSWHLEPGSNAVIYFTNTESSAIMQAKIDSMNKFLPYDRYYTFWFRNGTGGTYATMTNPLVWQGFYGGGVINIYGNSANARIRRTNQTVSLCFTNAHRNGLEIKNNNVGFDIQNLKVQVLSPRHATNNASPLYVLKCDKSVRARGCYFWGTTTNDGRGVYVNDGKVGLESNVYGYVKTAIYGAQCAQIYNRDSISTNEAPSWGFGLTSGSIAGNWGLYPTGTVSLANTNFGGGFIDR